MCSISLCIKKILAREGLAANNKLLPVTFWPIFTWRASGLAFFSLCIHAIVAITNHFHFGCIEQHRARRCIVKMYLAVGFD